MVRLYALVFIIQVILAIVALISCLSAEESEIRALPRLAWAMVILLFPLLGSIAWFIAGRPVAKTTTTGQGPTRATPVPGEKSPRHRPLAPDDDPDFLKSLDVEQAQRDRQMFDQWESDLRRREDELRRRQAGDPPPGHAQPDV